MSNEGMSPIENFPISKQPNMLEMQKNNSQVAEKSLLDDAVTYHAKYPEIYFKLIPFIHMTCEAMRTYGITLPTQEQLEQLSDGILDDFCKMYPDMPEYFHKDDAVKADPPSDPPSDPPRFGGGFRDGFRDGFRPGFGFGFRRRGLGRDFISTLLLAGLLSGSY